jgi:endonuclease III
MRQTKSSNGLIPRFTAPVWNLNDATRDATVRSVCRELHGQYGRPRLGNPIDPTDDLFYLLLSNRSHPKPAVAVFEALKRRFSTWDDVIRCNVRDLMAVLKPAGLHETRARSFRAIVQRLRSDFGRASLTGLRSQTADEVFVYLTSLDGVSTKVAKCVMMYTLGFNVLPVDAHVHRIARRLGWSGERIPERAHDELEHLVPPLFRYSFHVTCVAHGRAVCRARLPRCSECCIATHCAFPGLRVDPRAPVSDPAANLPGRNKLRVQR